MRRNQKAFFFFFAVCCAVALGIAEHALGATTYLPGLGPDLNGLLRIREVQSSTTAFGTSSFSGPPNAGDTTNFTTLNNLITSPGANAKSDYFAPVLNIRDDGSLGKFGGDSKFSVPLAPGATGLASPIVFPTTQRNAENNVALQANGTIRITTPGWYVFGVNSDDGFRLAFKNDDFAAGNNLGPGNVTTFDGVSANAGGALQTNGTGGVNSAFGAIKLAAGDHPFSFQYFESTGASKVELFSSTAPVAPFNQVAAPVLNFNDMEAPSTNSTFRNNTGTSFSAAGQFVADYSNTNLVGGAGTVNTGTTGVPGVGIWSVYKYPTGALTTVAPSVFSVDPSGIPQNPTGNPPATGLSSPLVNYDFNSTSTKINFEYSGGNGGHTNGVAFPHSASPGTAFSYFAQADLTVSPTDAGNYTFAVYGRLGSLFRILDVNNNNTPVTLLSTNADSTKTYNGSKVLSANADSFGTGSVAYTTGSSTANLGGNDFIGRYFLPAGSYKIQAMSNHGSSTAGWFIYGTRGLADSFDPSRFQLLGESPTNTPWTETINAGLQLVPEPTSFMMALLGMIGFLGMARRKRS